MLQLVQFICKHAFVSLFVNCFLLFEALMEDWPVKWVVSWNKVLYHYYLLTYFTFHGRVRGVRIYISGYLVTVVKTDRNGKHLLECGKGLHFCNFGPPGKSWTSPGQNSWSRPWPFTHYQCIGDQQQFSNISDPWPVSLFLPSCAPLPSCLLWARSSMHSWCFISSSCPVDSI